MKIPDETLRRILSSEIRYSDDDILSILNDTTIGVSFEYFGKHTEDDYKKYLWLNILTVDSVFDRINKKWNHCRYVEIKLSEEIELTIDMMGEVIPLDHPELQEVILTVKMMTL